MSETITIPEAAELLLRSKRTLILTHERPDGDALGSSLGMQEYLLSCGVNAETYLPEAPAERYRSLIGSYKTELLPEELPGYEQIVLLDCATTERIACGPAVKPAELPVEKMINIDHHRGNNVAAAKNLVQPDSAAAGQIAAEIAIAGGKELNCKSATLFLLGILTDTGAFRFTNTLGNTMRVAADLLDRGAELERIVNASYYSKPLRQQKFECEMVGTCEKLALDGQYIYAFIPDSLFRKYEFDMRDGEGLIDLLREVAGTRIAALFYKKGDAFKVSLRSKDSATPVGPMARALGGGGHDMAAGITLTGMNDREVEALLLEKVSELLKK